MSWATDTGKEQDGGTELPPIKELYFARQGREFLVRSGYAAFYEDTKTLPYFYEIRENWRIAVRDFNVGTPKRLNADSTAEQGQVELFFMELRHGDLALALKKYYSLIQKRSKDQVFCTAVARVIKRQSAPNPSPLSLPFYILAAWIHGFLWGLSNEERADTLRRVYGVTIRSAVGDASEVVRKTVARLKLKSWSDYREVYSKPPFSLLLFHMPQHEECQIVLRSTGQS
jgi:hypothetical protein